MKPIQLTVLLLMYAAWLRAGTFEHANWQHVLGTHVNEIGEVDYAALKNSTAALDAYIRQLAEASPDSHPERFASRHDKLAYWLNAYNAFTVRGVVAGYPTASVRDLGFLFGFFRKKAYVAGGSVLSLHQIEHEMIRERFGDARIHFAIVCASISCPRLDREAFNGVTLDEHLDRLARRFIGERRNVTINEGENEIRLSKVFDWFAEDFEAAANGRGSRAILAFIRGYADEEARALIDGIASPRIRYHDYDWGLNGPGLRARAKSTLERELASGIVGR